MLSRPILFLSFLVALSGAARADVDYPVVGDRGDHQDRDRCAAGQYLVGLVVRSGAWIDSVALKCSNVPAGHAPTLTTLMTRGGPGGNPFAGTDQCAAGSVAAGVRFTFTNNNRQVRKLILECRPLKGGDATEVAVGVVGDTQSPHDHICPAHQVAVGLHVNWGKHVNGVGVVCDAEPVKSLPGPSDVSKFSKCDSYARSANEQSAEALSRQCDTDQRVGRWQVNYGGHFGWCWSMTAANDLPNKERGERAGLLSRCRTLKPLGGGTTPPAPACTASAVVTNRACMNVDGSPSTVLAPGSLHAAGCGATDAQALAFAKAQFASQAALAEQPTPGACTYAVQKASGCLCR